MSALKEAVLPAERTFVLDQAIRPSAPAASCLCPASGAAQFRLTWGKSCRKGLTLRSGQTHVKRYLEPLTKLILEKKVDTTFVITHRNTDLRGWPYLYKTFKEKKNGCVKVVFQPGG